MKRLHREPGRGRSLSCTAYEYVRFFGPSLPRAQAGRVLDAVYLPPVAQGDVYLAVKDGAEAIGSVDGYFQQVPSVWHKAILWALSKVVHVFGAASMGALRAPELHTLWYVRCGPCVRVVS